MVDVDLYSDRAGMVATDLSLGEEIISNSSYPPVHVLLREALQNSNDAAIDKQIDRAQRGKQVKFEAKRETLDQEKIDFLGETIFAHASKRLNPRLYRALDSTSSNEVLILRDSNTTGLIGAVESTRDNRAKSNWVKFFFVTGGSNHNLQEDKGGSYGVGRNILFSFSQSKTILVYTKIKEKASGLLVSRFMACSLDVDVTGDGGIEYSGMHFWGRRSSDEMAIFPIEGEDADLIASRLGLTILDGNETGTSIMVLHLDMNPTDLDLSKETRASEIQNAGLIEGMRDAFVIWAWPHLIHRSIEARFLDLGIEIVPDIDEPRFKFLSGFRHSYLQLLPGDDSDDGGEDQEITTENEQPYEIRYISPPVKLGDLFFRFPPQGFGQDERFAEEFGELIPNDSIALMRQVRFVVRYHKVAKAKPGFCAQGVFLTSDSNVPFPGSDLTVDQIARHSETAAHDSWLPDRVRLGRGKPNPVKRIFEDIKKRILEVSKTFVPSASGTGVSKLGIDLMFGISRTERGNKERGGGGGGGGGASRYRLEQSPTKASRQLRFDGNDRVVGMWWNLVDSKPLEDPADEISVNFEIFVSNEVGKGISNVDGLFDDVRSEIVLVTHEDKAISETPGDGFVFSGGNWKGEIMVEVVTSPDFVFGIDAKIKVRG